jgi:hypothetical protein
MVKYPYLLSAKRSVLHRKDLPALRLPEKGSVTDEINVMPLNMDYCPKINMTLISYLACLFP